MQSIRHKGPWALALICAIGFSGGAAVITQSLMADKSAEVRVPAVHDAHDLSRVFRHVARKALPSIVSIETVGKAVQLGRSSPEIDLFGEDSPFGELFKNDPRFREMFKNIPRSIPQQMPRSRGMGSGFIIDADGIVLTNSHVVADAEQVKIKLHDGREFIGRDIRTDPRSDVAIVRFDAPEGLQPLELGNSDTAEIGDWVLAVGSPFGLDLTVTAGIISAKSRGVGINEREDFLQTDAAINPGNSGGPLLDLEGKVIGINTAISSRSGGYDGVGFAIPINMVHWVSRQLIESGTVRRGYLGVGIQRVSHELAQQFNVPFGKGAIVTQVLPKSPASVARLEPGDLIVKLNGRDVVDPRDLQGIVEQLEIGKEYPLEIVRNGKPMQLKIKIGELPTDTTVAAAEKEEESSAPKDPNTFEELGIGVQDLTEEMAQKLGYEGSVSGVLVSSVRDGSPAATAGLRTGMVIEKVGTTAVTSTEEFAAALKGQSVEKGILVLVRTPRGSQFLVLKK